MGDAVGDAGLLHRGNRITAADDGGSLHSGDGLGDRVRAGREGVDLEDAHRTIPDDGLRVGNCRGVRGDRRRSDVDAHPVSNGRVAYLEHFVRRARLELRRDDMVGRQQQRDAARLRVRFDRLGLIELVVFDQRSTDRDAARLEERVGHRAADDQAVHLAEHVLDDVDLVRDFRAAEYRDERPLRLLQRLPEVLQLFFHQQPRRRLLEAVRDAFHRRVRAMRGAKGVVHVARGERRQRLCECGVVLFFLRMKAQVLEQDDVALHRARLLADAVGREGDRLPEQLGQAIRDRPQAHVRVDLALGSSQVAREHDRRALSERVLDGGQRRLDARVVADDAVLQRDVEVHADENALALEIQIFDREFRHRITADLKVCTTSVTRQT